MSLEEEAKITEKLTKQLSEKFILIPKNRWYFVVGGMLAFIGVSVGSVIAYLRTEPAELARTRIKQIQLEAEQLLAAMKSDSYVRIGEIVRIRTTETPSRALEPYPLPQTGVTAITTRDIPFPQQQWVIELAPK